MLREDFVFCIGYSGNTAIVDKALRSRHGRARAQALARKGLYKQAGAAALYDGAPEDMPAVLQEFNKTAVRQVGTVEELPRVVGVNFVPDNVKKANYL
jgi:hypothetical protein